MFQNVHVQRQVVNDRFEQLRREAGASRQRHDLRQLRRLVRPGPSR